MSVHYYLCSSSIFWVLIMFVKQKESVIIISYINTVFDLIFFSVFFFIVVLIENKCMAKEPQTAK